MSGFLLITAGVGRVYHTGSTSPGLCNGVQQFEDPNCSFNVAFKGST